MFPADNVILPKNKDQVIKCDQCTQGNMKLGHIFPQSSGKKNIYFLIYYTILIWKESVYP